MVIRNVPLGALVALGKSHQDFLKYREVVSKRHKRHKRHKAYSHSGFFCSSLEREVSQVSQILQEQA